MTRLTPPPLGRAMLRAALRKLVPAGAIALLALASAPETARAADECGVAMSNAATCGPTVGDLPDGIYYEDSTSGGLTVTVRGRQDSGRNPTARTIKNREYDSADGAVGHGIAVRSNHGDADLTLVVEGDTNIVRRAAPDGTTPITSRSGVFVENIDTARTVRGDLRVTLGAEVDIGAEGALLQEHGIFARNLGGSTVIDTASGGIEITSRGKIYAGERGIRAASKGQKIASPSAGDLNGKVEITHGGLISAGGWGIHALSEGNADVTVTIQEGGTVTGGGGGIYAQTKGSAGPGGSGNIMISSAGTIDLTAGQGIEADAKDGTGNTVNITVSAGTVASRSDTGIETSSGASTGATTITVGAGASVSGGGHGIHATHNGTDVAVNINIAGTVTGGSDAGEAAIKIKEVAGSATPAIVTLTNGFRINGDILFDGGGDDTLTLNVAGGETGQVTGDITNIDDLLKTGMGMARLGGDLAFAGSSAEIREGVLILRGHLNLGGGTLEVKEDGRFAVEVAGDDSDGNADHGQVTAGTVTLANGEIFVTAVSGTGEEAARAKARSGITIFVEQDGTTADADAVPDSTIVRLLDGTEIATVTDGAFAGEIPASGGDNGDGGDNGNGGGDNGNGGGGGSDSAGGSGGGGSGGAALLVVGGGALAYLLWDLGLFDDEALLGSEESGKQFGTLVHGFSSAPSGIRSGDEGIEYRVRLLESGVPAVTAILPASGVATSLRAHLGNGFHADLTGTQNLSASFDQDSLSGSRYGLSLGWRSGVFSTDIGYSHSPMRAQSSIANSAGLGELSGTYGLRHDQMRANAKLGFQAGGVVVSPSVSMFGGTMSQDAYTASSQVWFSEVPSISQDYAGWKAGLALRPSSDLQALGLRWRPELRLTTTRLSGSNSNLMARVKDRAGALQFHAPARATLPRAVHALGGVLKVAGDEAWSLRGGYLASLIDEELVYAAGAQMRVQF